MDGIVSARFQRPATFSFLQDHCLHVSECFEQTALFIDAPAILSLYRRSRNPFPRFLSHAFRVIFTILESHREVYTTTNSLSEMFLKRSNTCLNETRTDSKTSNNIVLFVGQNVFQQDKIVT